MKTKIILVSLTLSCCSPAVGQGQKTSNTAIGVQTYSGIFNGGQATYAYKEDANGERIYDGNFQFSETTPFGTLFKVNGRYKEDKKDGQWIYTTTLNNMLGNVNGSLKVSYKEGKMNGSYSYVESGKVSVVTINENTQLTMKNNLIVGPLKRDTKNNLITGNFTNEGLPDGKWIHRTIDNNIYENIEIYRKGCLIKKQEKNVSTGKIDMQNIDDENAIDTDLFFNAYDSINNSSLINGIYYKLEEVYNVEGRIPTSASGLIISRFSDSHCSPYNFKGEEEYKGVPYKKIVIDKEKKSASDDKVQISMVDVVDVEKSAADSQDHKVMEQEEQDKVYDHVEVEATFPGGNKEITAWLAKNMQYPPVAVEQGIQGRVITRFVIEKDGSIGEVQILRPLDPSLDKEAIRVVKAMPRWSPGKNNGHAVRVWFNLPLTFRLE